MELNAEQRQAAVRQTHDDAGGDDIDVFAVLPTSPRRDVEFVRNRGGDHGERVIPGGGEGRLEAREHAVAVVPDLGDLAVHELLGVRDNCAVDLRERLVAKAHAQHRCTGAGAGLDHTHG